MRERRTRLIRSVTLFCCALSIVAWLPTEPTPQKTAIRVELGWLKLSTVQGTGSQKYSRVLASPSLQAFKSLSVIQETRYTLADRDELTIPWIPGSASIHLRLRIAQSGVGILRSEDQAGMCRTIILLDGTHEPVFGTWCGKPSASASVHYVITAKEE